MEKNVMDYFAQVTVEKFALIEKRFDKLDVTLENLDATLEDLKKVKWSWTGGLLVINVLISAGVALTAAWIAR